MTSKEKAAELINKYNLIVLDTALGGSNRRVKQCALFAVNEVIDSYTKEKSYGYVLSDKIIPYWEEVKQEIEKL